MNITIILPAVHVTNNKRQHRGDESPQPTTPFPPISITPSPTPFSETNSYNPEDYKHLIEEYNREIAENQLTRSRAEIVKRQAAYDDIEVAKSDSGTTIENESTAASSSSPVATKGLVAASAPCPYCSSSDSIKSGGSSRSLPRQKITAVANFRSAKRQTERRSTTHTTPSTDLESPSSVDTVNTVIQSKAYDILGELKQKESTLGKDFDIASTFDDSFESIDSVQEPPAKNDFPDYQELSECDVATTKTTVAEGSKRSTPPLRRTPSLATPSPTLGVGVAGTASKSPTPSLSPSPPVVLMQNDYFIGAEERNLDSLYEEDEEENEEGLLDEVVPPPDLDTTTDERILSEEKENDTQDTHQPENESYGESMQPEDVSLEEDIPPTPQAQPSPEEKQDEGKTVQTIKTIQNFEEEKEDILKSTEQVSVTEVVESQKFEIEKNDKKEILSLVAEESQVQEDIKIEHEEAPKSPEQKVAEALVNTVVMELVKEKKEQEEQQLGEIGTDMNVERQVPVTEPKGNGEVQIIVTQDDMPAANMFDR